MNFLKNKRDWKKWIKEEGLANQSFVTVEPLEYPSFAYCTVASFGYEEKWANYLYFRDIDSMYIKLSENRKTS